MDETKRELAEKSNLGGGGLVLALLFATPVLATVNLGDNVLDTVAEVDTKVDAKAPIASPTFTGTVSVPAKTSAAVNNTTLVATEAQVFNAIVGAVSIKSSSNASRQYKVATFTRENVNNDFFQLDVTANAAYQDRITSGQYIISFRYNDAATIYQDWRVIRSTAHENGFNIGYKIDGTTVSVYIKVGAAVGGGSVVRVSDPYRTFLLLSPTATNSDTGITWAL